MSEGRRLGRVVGLWRYPVKSMAGEPLTEADVSWHGFVGDRRWAFVRSGLTQNPFPWLTIRERHDMGRYLPSFVDPSRPENSPTEVRTPAGEVFDIADPALADELYPEGVHLVRHACGVFDTLPLSLITTQTIAELGKSVDMTLDVRRFRPNILLESDDQAPFCEDDWVGQTLRIGSLRMRIDKRDGRCVVITTDPDTGERSPTILRSVFQQRQGCLGVYGSVVEPGRVAINDAVLMDAKH